MDEKYRLVFRGEVLDGQHRAVVKRRLMGALNLTEPQLEKLFSGNTVVLKKAADTSTAASYQEIFKKAGGRLRVMPVEQEQAQEKEKEQEQHQLADQIQEHVPQSETAAAGAAPGDATQPSFSLVTIDTPAPNQSVQERAQEIEAPDFAVAEVGAVLVEAPAPAAVTIPEADFELAEVGADLLQARARVDKSVEETRPPVVDFELAEVGADIGVGEHRPAAPPPDTSHIQLAES